MTKFEITIEAANYILTWYGWAFNQADAERKAKLAWGLINH